MLIKSRGIWFTLKQSTLLPFSSLSFLLRDILNKRFGKQLSTIIAISRLLWTTRLRLSVLLSSSLNIMVWCWSYIAKLISKISNGMSIVFTVSESLFTLSDCRHHSVTSTPDRQRLRWERDEQDPSDAKPPETKKFLYCFQRRIKWLERFPTASKFENFSELRLLACSTDRRSHC